MKISKRVLTSLPSCYAANSLVSDRFLLTSDGVHGVVEHETLTELMRRGDDLQAIARAMIEAALAAGSRDNLTAVVGEYQAG